MKLRKMYADEEMEIIKHGNPDGPQLRLYPEPWGDNTKSVYVLTENELRELVRHVILNSGGYCAPCGHHLDGEPTINIKQWLDGDNDIELLEIG